MSVTPAQIKKSLNAGLSQNPFGKLMSIKVESCKKSQATLVVPCNATTISHGGSLYGGVIAFAADIAMWVALMTIEGDIPVSTTDLSVRYLEKFTRGDAKFDARILRSGKRLITAACDIYNEKGVLAAHATASFIRR